MGAWDAAELLHRSARRGDTVVHAALVAASLGLIAFNCAHELPHFFMAVPLNAIDGASPAADAVLVHAGCRLAHLARAAPLLRYLLCRREHALDCPRRALPPARRKQAGASVGPDEAEHAVPLK